jgi:hypothetical protein
MESRQRGFQWQTRCVRFTLASKASELETDIAKGSFYARPGPDRLEAEGSDAAYLRPNVWPTEDCPGYREAFKALAGFMREVGILLARALDKLGPFLTF